MSKVVWDFDEDNYAGNIEIRYHSQHISKKDDSPIDIDLTEDGKFIMIKKKQGNWPGLKIEAANINDFDFILPDGFEPYKQIDNETIEFTVPDTYKKNHFKIGIKCRSVKYTGPDTTVTIGDAKPGDPPN